MYVIIDKNIFIFIIFSYFLFKVFLIKYIK